MFHRYLPCAALIAFGAAQPALAAPAVQGAAPAAKPAATTQTRASLANSLQGNFKAIDANGDGTLSAAELQAVEAKALQQRVVNARARVEGEFTKLDTNRDGQLSKAEFMAVAPTAPTQAPNGAALLAQLDKNKDGKITIDEYRTPILGRFDSLDTNKDGTLSQSERAAAQARAARK
ncbi:MAG: EF-hand domain-containing protein [Sphingomicrobium sp.]